MQIEEIAEVNEQENVRRFRRRELFVKTRSLGLRLIREGERIDEEEESLLYSSPRTDRVGVSGTRNPHFMEGRIAEHIDRKDSHETEKSRWMKMKAEAVSASENLPEKQKDVLRLRYIDCLTWTEIADRMGISDRWAYELARDALDSL